MKSIIYSALGSFFSMVLSGVGGEYFPFGLAVGFVVFFGATAIILGAVTIACVIKYGNEKGFWDSNNW